jgi:hypothetical protein
MVVGLLASIHPSVTNRGLAEEPSNPPTSLPRATFLKRLHGAFLAERVKKGMTTEEVHAILGTTSFLEGDGFGFVDYYPQYGITVFYSSPKFELVPRDAHIDFDSGQLPNIRVTQPVQVTDVIYRFR